MGPGIPRRLEFFDYGCRADVKCPRSCDGSAYQCERKFSTFQASALTISSGSGKWGFLKRVCSRSAFHPIATTQPNLPVGRTRFDESFLGSTEPMSAAAMSPPPRLNGLNI